MADYGAFPLWEGSGAFMLGRDALPLPEGLRTALDDWARFHDQTLSSNKYEWPSEDIERSFVERGRVLARHIASALGTEYVVLYFNAETGKREALSPTEAEGPSFIRWRGRPAP